MNRKHVIIILALFLCVLIGALIPWLMQPHPGRQVGYIPPAPITAAPIVLSPTPTRTSTWTPTPSPLPFTATPTVRPSSTPTAVSVTPTLGPDRDTRGDAPVTQPVTGAAPVTADIAFVIGLLTAILTFVSGGGIARYADKWERFKNWKQSPNLKMFAVYGATFIAGGVLTWLINYAVPNWWGLVPEAAQWLIVSISMFAVSQKWHDNDKAAQATLQKQVDAVASS